MNKVDVMCVDASGGMAVQGMSYQVVQRFEHISTTTAVVPRYPTAAAAPAATATEQVGQKSISLISHFPVSLIEEVSLARH